MFIKTTVRNNYRVRVTCPPHLSAVRHRWSSVHAQRPDDFRGAGQRNQQIQMGRRWHGSTTDGTICRSMHRGLYARGHRKTSALQPRFCDFRRHAEQRQPRVSGWGIGGEGKSNLFAGIICNKHSRFGLLVYVAVTPFTDTRRPLVCLCRCRPNNRMQSTIWLRNARKKVVTRNFAIFCCWSRWGLLVCVHLPTPWQLTL